METDLQEGLARVRALLADPGLVRATAAGRRHGGPAPDPARAVLRPVDLRAGRRLQVAAHTAGGVRTTNHAPGPDADAVLDDLLAQPYGSWAVVTAATTLQLRVTKRGRASQVATASDPIAATSGPTALPAAPHDRVKPRLLDPAEPYLAALGLTQDGVVRRARADKYAQVDQFARLAQGVVLSAVAAGHLGRTGPVRLVDLGCGHGYLTFTAAHVLGQAGVEVALTGVDRSRAAVAHNAAVAAALGLTDAQARFVVGDIATADVDGADVVVALHACDTATDDALARAVAWGAPLVLAAPCCHHDIAAQLSHADLGAGERLMVRDGILRERLADTLTDALRAALLRLVGYRVDVVEFVESAHTPRNTLLRAVRTGAAPAAGAVDAYLSLVRVWGVTPALETRLAARLPVAVMSRPRSDPFGP